MSQNEYKENELNNNSDKKIINDNEYNGEAIFYASPTNSGSLKSSVDLEKSCTFFNKNTKYIVVGIITVFLVMALLIGINIVQRNNLKNRLEKRWVDVEDDILKVLEFNDGEVEYRLETEFSWLDTTVFTRKYKVVGRNKIAVKLQGKDIIYNVELNDSSEILTIEPALTSTDSIEFWYDIGY